MEAQPICVGQTLRSSPLWLHLKCNDHTRVCGFGLRDVGEEGRDAQDTSAKRTSSSTRQPRTWPVLSRVHAPSPTRSRSINRPPLSKWYERLSTLTSSSRAGCSTPPRPGTLTPRRGSRASSSPPTNCFCANSVPNLRRAWRPRERTVECGVPAPLIGAASSFLQGGKAARERRG